MLIFNYTKTLYIYGTFSTLKKCVLTSTVLFKSCWIPCEVRASVAKNSVNILYVKVKKKKVAFCLDLPLPLTFSQQHKAVIKLLQWINLTLK